MSMLAYSSTSSDGGGCAGAGGRSSGASCDEAPFFPSTCSSRSSSGGSEQEEQQQAGFRGSGGGGGGRSSSSSSSSGSGSDNGLVPRGRLQVGCEDKTREYAQEHKHGMKLFDICRYVFIGVITATYVADVNLRIIAYDNCYVRSSP